MRDRTKGMMYALLAVALWSTLGVGFKLAVNGLDSFAVTFLVGLFATAYLLIHVAINGKLGGLIGLFCSGPAYFILAGIIGLGIHPVLYIKGYSLLPASSTVVVFYTYPIMMILLSAAVFRDKLSYGSVFSVLLGFVGVFILVMNGSIASLSLSLGVVLTLLAAFCWALFSVMIKYRPVDADAGMFLYNLFGLMFLCAMIPFFGVSFPIGIKPLLGLVYLGVFPTAIAFVVWNRALHMADTGICSNIALLTPVMSILIIFLVLGDALSLWHLVGLMIVLGSPLINVNLNKQEADNWSNTL